MAQWDYTAQFWMQVHAVAPPRVVLDRSAPVQFCEHPLPPADEMEPPQVALPQGAYFPGARLTAPEPEPFGD